MILKFDKLFLKSSSQYITNTIESSNVAILNFAEITTITEMISLLFRLTPLQSGDITINGVSINFFDKAMIPHIVKVVMDYDNLEKISGYDYLGKIIERRSIATALSSDELKELIPDICSTLQIDNQMLYNKIDKYDYFEILQLKLIEFMISGAKILIVADSKNKVNSDVFNLLDNFSKGNDVLILVVTTNDSLQL